jgi:hypothetical protein
MAANVLGIGHRNVIKISCDLDGRMKPSSLEMKLHLPKRRAGYHFVLSLLLELRYEVHLIQLENWQILLIVRVYGITLMRHGVVVVYSQIS